MELHENTFKILGELEKYYPAPPKERKGYFVSKCTISRVFKAPRCPYKFTITPIRCLDIEFIKNGSFINTLNLKVYPEIYGLFAYWSPISNRYGYRHLRGKNMFYFTLLNKNEKLSLVTCKIK